MSCEVGGGFAGNNDSRTEVWALESVTIHSPPCCTSTPGVTQLENGRAGRCVSHPCATIEFRLERATRF